MMCISVVVLAPDRNPFYSPVHGGKCFDGADEVGLESKPSGGRWFSAGVVEIRALLIRASRVTPAAFDGPGVVKRRLSRWRGCGGAGGLGMGRGGSRRALVTLASREELARCECERGAPGWVSSARWPPRLHQLAVRAVPNRSEDSDWVFGYGSIINNASRARQVDAPAVDVDLLASAASCEWNFRAPSGFTAVGLRRDNSAPINGVLFRVPAADAFDSREAGYERSPISPPTCASSARRPTTTRRATPPRRSPAAARASG